MEKIRMHKKMAMTGKSPGGAGSAIGRAAKAGLRFGVAGAALGAAGAGAAMLGRKLGKKLDERLDERKAIKRDEAKVQKKMGGGMMQRPMGYKMGGGVKKPVTVKEITPKGRKGVLIYKGKAKDYKPVGKNK